MPPGAGSGEAQPRMKQCKHSLNLKKSCTKLLANAGSSGWDEERYGWAAPASKGANRISLY